MERGPLQHEHKPLRRLVGLIHDYTLRLAQPDAAQLLAIAGFLSGIATGGLIIVFRGLVEGGLAHMLPGGDVEAFELLPVWQRVLLPLGGAVLIALLLMWIGVPARQVGIVHVLARLERHAGVLPLRNAVVQFIGGALALMSGQSMGREGPAVHLGAATSSLFGQAIGVPHNALRTLVACGAAAAIAGSFNTPMAGVIFAMEVIMLEYTVASFIPVILASVSATVVVQLVYDEQTAFSVPRYDLQSLYELPWMVLTALCIGAIAALFIEGCERCNDLQRRPLLLRLSLAGGFTGLIGMLVPEVLGVGYDTVEAALFGDVGLELLAVVLIAKLAATSVAVGTGLPAGLIGPTLLMGAAAGGIFGILAEQLRFTQTSSPGFYALLGMGAMMGAVLQAPLAALMTVLEMTLNANAIMPAMLMIVVASMTTSELFRKRSIFVSMLEQLGLTSRPGPLQQALNRVGVTTVMERRFTRIDRFVDAATLLQRLESQPLWAVIEDESGAIGLLPAIDLQSFLAERHARDERRRDATGNAALALIGDDEPIDLTKVPGAALQLVDIDYRATMSEALELIRARQVGAACVRRTTAPFINPIVGILTRRDIEKVYELGT